MFCMNEYETLTHTIRHNVFAASDDPFEISEAQVFAYTPDGSIRVLVEYHDPYQALWTAAFANLNNGEDGIGIITTGWAAPTGNTDTAPSEHPDRRRVHLITITSRSLNDAAILTFQDGSKSEITFAEGGTGQLADALHGAMRIITLLEQHTSI
jgi:hypothetical protein